MTVVVTGCLGQIGSHVTEAILGLHNFKVIGIDNLETGRQNHLTPHPKLTFIRSSICDSNIVNQIFEKFKPDFVIHTAASYKEPMDWYNHNMTNTLGTVNLIKASKNANIKRFIYLNTSLCYSSSNGQHKEDDLVNPINSSYAISKASGEHFLTISNLDYVSFRLSNILGPRNLVGPLPIFYKRIKSKKRCFVTDALRDFVHVKDLVEIILKAILGTGYGIYNFASGKCYSIRDLYDQTVEVLGVQPYPEPIYKKLGNDHVDVLLLDTFKLKEHFGEKSFFSLKTIVEDAILYYDEYGTEGEISHLKFN